MSKIKTKVLTTTSNQELSAEQAQNARTNVSAQVKLTTDENSHITLTDVHEDDDATKPIVSQKIASKMAYSAGESGKYLNIDNEAETIDLSEEAKAKLNTKSDWNAAAGSDAEILNKPTIPDAAHDGKLTFRVGGKLLSQAFSADSSDDVEIDIDAATYEPATEDKDGLMSKTDKKKLNGIAEGAQVNVQSDWNESNSKADSFIKNKPTIPAAANNGKLTINFTNKNNVKTTKVFTANDSQDTSIDITDTDTTYEVATQEKDGLLSKEDKKKIDSSVVPNDGKLTITVKTNGVVAKTSEFTANSATDENVEIDITTYGKATTTSDGLMSKEDKAKVDGMATVNDGKLTLTFIDADGKISTTDFSANSGDNLSFTVKNTDTTYDNATIAKDGLMSKADKAKLDSLSKQEQANWAETNPSSVSYIQNKPTIPDPANDGSLTFTVGGVTLDASFSADSASDVVVAIPNANPNDENSRGVISGADKSKLDGIESGAEVNVQSDWNQTDNTKDDFIKNKPSIPDPANDGELVVKLAGVTFDSNFSANSADMVIIDIPEADPDNANGHGLISGADKSKLDGIESGAEVNVQSDWNQTDNTKDDFIKNKPSIPDPANDGSLIVKLAGVTFDSNFSADVATDIVIDIPAADAAKTSEYGLISGADKAKLDGIESGAEVNVQADWNQTDNTKDDFIKNKPDINDGKFQISLAGITLDESFTANSADDVTIDIPAADSTKTSEYGLVSGADKGKLDGIETGAEVNVQSDWNQSDNTKDDFIKNKPAINDGNFNISLAGVTLDESFSANSAADVTIDIPAADSTKTSAYGLISGADKAKLDGIESGAEVNVQADWNQTDNTKDDFIKNKPDINDGKFQISLVGVTLDETFTANSAEDVIIDIPAADAAKTTDYGLISGADKGKLDGIESGAEVNVQSDWNQSDNTKDDFIKNKPDINDGNFSISLAGVTLDETFTANSAEDVIIDIPAADATKTTDYGLISGADKGKLDGIESGAEVNVQSDWNQSDNTKDDFIKNKPDINDGKFNLSLAGVTLDETFSANSAEDVIIDIPAADSTKTTKYGLMSGSDKGKLDGIEDGAEVNVQSDWNQSDNTKDDFIKNKPVFLATANVNGDNDSLTIVNSEGVAVTFDPPDTTYSDGNGITIDSDNVISVDNGNGLTFDDSGKETVNIGNGLAFTDDGKVAASNGNGLTFDADGKNTINGGNGLTFDTDGKVAVDVGDGIVIDENGKVTTYNGNGITIDGDGKNAINEDKGLTFDENGKLNVDKDKGLAFDDDGKLSTYNGNGLTFDENGKNIVNDGNGIAFDENGKLISDNGNGLTFDSDGKNTVDMANGLTFDANGKLAVDAGEGLTFDESGKMSVEPYTAGEHINIADKVVSVTDMKKLTFKLPLVCDATEEKYTVGCNIQQDPDPDNPVVVTPASEDGDNYTKIGFDISILKSLGFLFSTSGINNVLVLTSQEYEAIESKDAKTLYLVIEE